MPDILVIQEKGQYVITVNDQVVGIVEKDTPEVVTIGIQGPAGPAGDGTVKYIAGENLSGHRLVYANNDKLYYADSSNLIHANRILGITTGAASINQAATIVTYGELTEPTWNWDIIKPIYAGISGNLTQTTSSTGFIQIVATAITATKIFINIKPAIIII
jgi:hypothetical protein